MFTGIIETAGSIVSVWQEEDILNLVIRSAISDQLRPEQSVAHDGVCLTVVHVQGDTHTVQLVGETIRRSHFSNLMSGARINLERSMPASGRFEGHIVQGHVDCVGSLVAVHGGLHTFQYPEHYAKLLVEKGSICVNGVSLTVAGLDRDTFSVAIIPFTMAHTNFRELQPGALVNLEFDILAKYIVRIIELRDTPSV